MKCLPALLLDALVFLLLAGCGGGKKENAENAAQTRPYLEKGDTIWIGTLYSPTSYFLYRDEPMGYEYELACRYAESRGYVVGLKVLHNIEDLVQLMDKDSLDLLAYSVPQTSNYADRLDYCGPSMVDWQVLVQQRSDTMVKDVSQLPGKEVTVEKNSKFETRMIHLNEEIGGGIIINTIDRDTLIADDMVKMAADREIGITVVGSRTAQLNASFYPELDMTVPVSLEQRSSWAVKKGNDWLKEDIDKWWEENEESDFDHSLQKKYYEEEHNSLLDETLPVSQMLLGNGKISRYDAFFKRHSALPAWDWRLIAAIGWAESHFNPSVKSWSGARGIMQLMPRTAKNFGLPIERIEEPEANIEAGAKLIKMMDDDFKKRGIAEQAERQKFVIAAYNSGPGHIYDAMALAKKYGKNPTVWYGNVRECVMMKKKTQYYNDPVVKCGYFNGTETVNFVDKVLSIYGLYKQKIEI